MRFGRKRKRKRRRRRRRGGGGVDLEARSRNESYRRHGCIGGSHLAKQTITQAHVSADQSHATTPSEEGGDVDEFSSRGHALPAVRTCYVTIETLAAVLGI